MTVILEPLFIREARFVEVEGDEADLLRRLGAVSISPDEVVSLMGPNLVEGFQFPEGASSLPHLGISRHTMALPSANARGVYFPKSTVDSDEGYSVEGVSQKTLFEHFVNSIMRPPFVLFSSARNISCGVKFDWFNMRIVNAFMDSPPTSCELIGANNSIRIVFQRDLDLAVIAVSSCSDILFDGRPASFWNRKFLVDYWDINDSDPTLREFFDAIILPRAEDLQNL